MNYQKYKRDMMEEIGTQMDVLMVGVMVTITETDLVMAEVDMEMIDEEGTETIEIITEIETGRIEVNVAKITRNYL